MGRSVNATGTVRLTVKAKGKSRRALIRKGKVTLKVTVTFAPTGGDPNAQAKAVKLVKVPTGKHSPKR